MKKMQMRQEGAGAGQKRRKMQGPCAMEFASGNTGSWRLERPHVDFEICVKCGICAMYCPANVIEVNKDKKEGISILWEYCKGCGICANECPKHCITMIKEGSEG